MSYYEPHDAWEAYLERQETEDHDAEDTDTE